MLPFQGYCLAIASPKRQNMVLRLVLHAPIACFRLLYPAINLDWFCMHHWLVSAFYIHQFHCTPTIANHILIFYAEWHFPTCF